MVVDGLYLEGDRQRGYTRGVVGVYLQIIPPKFTAYKPLGLAPPLSPPSLWHPGESVVVVNSQPRCYAEYNTLPEA